MLRRRDSSLVVESRAPERGQLLLLPRRGGFVDRRVQFVEGMLVLDERCRDPLLGSIYAVDEDEASDFSGGGAREVDREAQMKEDLAHVAQVVVGGRF